MNTASALAPKIPTQGSLATRKAPLATLAERVEIKVAAARLALITAAPKGFATEVAGLMGWRPERRSRELSGVEKLSMATFVAELETHAACGRQDVVDGAVAALLSGLKTSSVTLPSGSLIRVFDHNGQLLMRFEQ